MGNLESEDQYWWKGVRNSKKFCFPDLSILALTSTQWCISFVDNTVAWPYYFRCSIFNCKLSWPLAVSARLNLSPVVYLLLENVWNRHIKWLMSCCHVNLTLLETDFWDSTWCFKVISLRFFILSSTYHSLYTLKSLRNPAFLRGTHVVTIEPFGFLSNRFSSSLTVHEKPLVLTTSL